MKTVLRSIFFFSFLLILTLCFTSCDSDADLVAEHVVLGQENNTAVDKTVGDK